MKPQRGFTGFTLIETLVVVALFSLLFGLTFEILVANNRSMQVTSDLQLAQNQAKLGIDHMALELYQTRIVNMAPAPPFSSSDNIAFQVNLGYDPSGNGIWGADGNTDYRLQYALDNANHYLLRRLLDSGTYIVGSRVLAVNAVGLSFSLPSVTTKTLSVSLTTQSGSGTYTMSSNVTLRN